MIKKILFLGRFAPPMHGAARMNELYYGSLKENYKVKKVKINYSSSVGDIGRFSVMKIFGIFIVFFRVLFWLIFFRPNLVYFEIAPTGFAFFRDSIYVLLCKIFRRKIVFSNHARGVGRVGGIRLSYYKFIFRKSKMVLLSPLLYNEFEKIYDRKDVHFLANGIEDELGKEGLKKRLENKKIRLLFLSNMIESKGPMDALKLCSKLKKNAVDFECYFIGAFDNNDFKKEWFSKMEKMGLIDECKYLGAVYGEDKKNIMKDIDFLVFPTKYPMECYPLVILEAFMYGIRVLTYDTAAIKEIVSKDFLGFVSKKRNIDELYSYLIKNKKIDERKKIRDYFKKRYTMEIAGKGLNKIIKKELG